VVVYAVKLAKGRGFLYYKQLRQQSRGPPYFYEFRYTIEGTTVSDENKAKFTLLPSLSVNFRVMSLMKPVSVGNGLSPMIQWSDVRTCFS
jgi:hypothetical protein